VPDSVTTGQLEAVVFDMDGVVTRTARLHARAWKQLFDEFLDERRARGETHAPFDPVKDYLAQVDGKPRYEGVRSFLESRGIEIPFGSPGDGPQVESACGLGNRKDRYFDRLLREEGVEVFDATVTRLRQLRALGVKTGLVTSSKHGGEIVRLAGLSELFDTVVDGNTAEQRGLRGKPDPDIFLEAARRLGVEPSRAAVVEDAAAGVEAGRRGGFACVVGVNRGANREALERAGADLLVDDLGALTAQELSRPQPRSRPSGLEKLDEIASLLAGRRLALFLDYDGTLTPIVSRPELATLSPQTRDALRRLASLATVAIVSGRALQDRTAPRSRASSGKSSAATWRVSGRSSSRGSRGSRGHGSRTRRSRSRSTTARLPRIAPARSRRSWTAPWRASPGSGSTTGRRCWRSGHGWSGTRAGPCCGCSRRFASTARAFCRCTWGTT
jgi:trehalose 6-phosphate phosphatase